MDYFQFRRDFEEALRKVKSKLPPDCTVQEPLWEVIVPPHSWQIETFFRFADGSHIRVWELYDKVAGLQLSRRLQWAYHYGPVTRTNAHGDAIHGNPDDPLTIRIDTCDGLHLHFETREPHYEQARVLNLQLEEVDWITFVSSVAKHRKTGKPLNNILGFTLNANG